MKIKVLILGILFTVTSGTIFAQKQWTLKECIDYAIENNINIQQSEISIKEGDIYLENAKNSRLPSLNASLGGNLFFGRGPSRDGTYTDNTQTSSNFGLNANIPIYEGSRIKNEILVNELNLRATMQGYEKAKEDLSLNIVSLYMQILFSKELLQVSKTQLELSEQFMNRNKILLDNGRSSESQYYESVSLVAKDKLTVTETKSQLSLNLLDLAQALNLVTANDFDIISTNPDIIDVNNINELRTSEQIYNIAVEYRPAVIGEALRLKSFEQQLKVVKASFLPRIGLSAGYGNSYFYSFTSGASSIRFAEQMRRNGNQSIGIGISIPIFNKFTTRNQVKLSELNIKKQTLTVQNTKIRLQKEIEQSYQNAEASRQAYLASTEALKAAQIAFKFETQKADAGRSTIFDFNDSKTRLVRSESELARAKYKFLFNKKILDFYSGIPLTEEEKF